MPQRGAKMSHGSCSGDIDALYVSSFEAGAEALDGGTVRGLEAPPSHYDRTFCVCTLKPTVVNPDLGGPIVN